MAHPRVLKRANGTRQVQISWGKVGGKRRIEYVGSGRADEEVELLLVEARERINAGQGTLDLGLGVDRQPGEPLQVVGSRMQVLWDALDAAFRALGFDGAASQGPGKVGFQQVNAHVMAPSGLRAWWRRAVAMLVWPDSRRIEMAVLRRVAMT